MAEALVLEAPRRVLVQAPTKTRKTMKEAAVVLGEALLPQRVEAGLDYRRRAEDLREEYWVAPLEVSPQEMFLEEQGIAAVVMEARRGVQQAAPVKTRKMRVTVVV